MFNKFVNGLFGHQLNYYRLFYKLFMYLFSEKYMY